MKKVLIIKPSSLGDIIHGLQVVESIRAQCPGLHVSWVVESAFRSVVEACPTVDAVFIFERQGGLRAFACLLQEIRSQEFDVVLDLQGLARSGLMTCAAQAKRKIGRADAREGAAFFYTEKVALPAARPAHAVDILAKYLPALGLREKIVSSLRFEFPDLPGAQDAVEGSVLVFPESRRPEKEWPHFARFLESAAERHPECRFAWCASARSAEKCPVAGNVINLAGATSLSEVIALIQNAALVIANDSGPVHVAAAVGTPVLALYGPTAPNQYGPYPLSLKTHRTLRAECGRIASLGLEEVMDAFGDLMA
jgi:lipopolysaccharide heptosyltransferase I